MEKSSYFIDGQEYTKDTTPDLWDVVEGFGKLHDDNNIARGVGLPRPGYTSSRPVAQPPIIAGEMCKRAVGKSILGRDGWKIRYFELREKMLTYYSKAPSQKGVKKGAIMVSQMVACEPTDPALFNKPNVFLIVFKFYICYIQTKDKDSMMQWVEELRTLIRAGNKVLKTFCPGDFQNGIWNCCQKKNRSEGCTPTSFFLTNRGQAREPSADAVGGTVPQREVPSHEPSNRGASTSAPSNSATVPSKFSAPWYFPEFSTQICEFIMKKANPGEYIARNSRGGDKIVMMVMDEMRRLRHFYLTPQPNGSLEISPGVFVGSLEKAMESFQRHPPRGTDQKDIVLQRIVKFDVRDCESGVVDKTASYKPSVSFTKRVLGSDDDVTPAHSPTSFTSAFYPPIYPEESDVVFHFAPYDQEAFEKMDTHDTMPEELPKYARGRDLNRYWDILPNPVTRVRLSLLPSGASSEYVNANSIRGYNNRSAREYIAAQAPESHTQLNFIRMIWEKNVDIVICLTKLFQDSKKKCHRYWPIDDSEPTECDNFSMTLIESTYGTGLVKYTFDISDGDDTRRICMFWMDSWPDHGVPTLANGEMDTTSILSLIRDVRVERRRRKRANPILVHCSAGIGRTGAYIAIDHCINAMQDNQKVDVLKIVEEIRCDRMGMIQHTQQYKFVYQAALDYARTRNQNVEVSVPVKEQTASKNVLKDTMSKKGTWKLKNLGDEFAVFSLEANPVKMKMNENDKSILDDDRNSHMEPPVVSDTAVQNYRTSLADIPLDKQPWFRANFSRAQAEEMLLDGYNGMFIVRESSNPGLYSISLQTGMANGCDASNVTNMLCLPCNDSGEQVSGPSPPFFKLGEFGEDYHESIPKLVYYYMEHPYARDDVTNAYQYFKFADHTAEDQSALFESDSAIAQRLKLAKSRSTNSMC